MNTVTPMNLAELFGASEKEILTYCGDQTEKVNLDYTFFNSHDRDRLILDILKRIDSGDLPRAGSARKGSWESGWEENLNDLIETRYDLRTLYPKYFKKKVPARLNREFIIPANEDFILNMSILFRNFCVNKFLADFDTIYEFGCGTGWHLAYMASQFPDKKLYGFDWAKSSQLIIKELAHHFGWNIEGKYFDFFSPGDKISLTPNSAVFTFGALEQLGCNFASYLNFILRQPVSLCVDIIGVNELYDESNLVDYLALRYHKRRNYLNGYLTHLKELEKQGLVKIIAIHRQAFGNVYDDPHSYIIWKPITS